MSSAVTDPATPDAGPAVDVDDRLVTVVVPARNEAGHIASCLRSILAQDHKDLQVVVVDGASTDATAEIVLDIARADPRVELLSNPAAIIPVSLNLALAAARGRWLVRVDAHATIPPGYVGAARELLQTTGRAGVGGRKDGVGTTPAGRAIAAAMGSRFGVGNSTYHYGTTVSEVEHVPFGAYRVDVARSLGGWDESLRVNQDFEFDHRLREAGHSLLFDPKLVILWQCRQRVPDLFQQYRRYGRGKVVVMRKHPSSVRARHLVAPGLVMALAGAAAVGARRPLAAGLVVAPYLAGTVAAAALTSGKVDGLRERAWLAPAFVAMHLGWGIGFWQGVADVGRTSVTSRSTWPAGRG